MNYPIREQKDKEFVAQFIKTAIKNALSFNLIESFQNYPQNLNNLYSPNLYYYPKPNQYTEVDDFALFSATTALSAANFKIEQLYRENKLPRDLRGKMHSLLRSDLNLPNKILKKRIFLESRKLFNIAYLWQSYEVSIEQKEYDLIERINDFYKYPIMCGIGSINICNLNCVMCSMFSRDLQGNIKNNYFAKKQELEWDLIKDFIDFLGEGVKEGYLPTITFIAAGETLADPRLAEFVAYGRQKGIHLISIFTNGLLLDKYYKKLLDSGLNRITISIDGASAETYRKIRGADLEKVENNVKLCAQYARELLAKGADVELGLNCVLVNENVEKEQQLYLQKWATYRDIIKVIRFTDCGWYDENGNPIGEEFDINKAVICNMPWRALNIDPYGNFSTCCNMRDSAFLRDATSIGNAHNINPKQAWNSKETAELRKQNLNLEFNSKYKICIKCTERFNGLVDELGNGIGKQENKITRSVE